MQQQCFRFDELLHKGDGDWKRGPVGMEFLLVYGPTIPRELYNQCLHPNWDSWYGYAKDTSGERRGANCVRLTAGTAGAIRDQKYSHWTSYFSVRVDI